MTAEPTYHRGEGREEEEAGRFVREHSNTFGELLRAAHEAYWTAATTGSQEAADRYARAVAAVKKLYADVNAAESVAAWLRGGQVADPVLERQLTLLHLQYTGNRLPTETIDDLARRTSEIERVFHSYRATLNGEPVTDNEIREILRRQPGSRIRRAAWEASKQIGRRVAEPLRELVRRRNAAARSLGFSNHYVMQLTLQEQEEGQLFTMLDAFRERSEGPFRRLRADLDDRLAERFGIRVHELRPWHWEDPFAQEAPSFGEVDLDGWFQNTDLVAMARSYFSAIGLPVEEVLQRSDLWEREGKSQHAFCIAIDRLGDVRILCNLRPTEHWAMVLLHELGHAVYDRFIPADLPFLLRQPAHTFATEAIAMLMGRLTRDPVWLQNRVGARLTESERNDVLGQLRAQMLVSARWMLVMAYFERELYCDPDRADLDSLWWELVERLQLIPRPDGRTEPDWAAKIHLTNVPAYYHNYLLGEWMTSQLTSRIDRELGVEALGRGVPGVGQLLRESVFRHGALLDWNELLVEGTGEPLSPDHFIREFVED
jgi:peptidyl-dipeptidase A